MAIGTALLYSCDKPNTNPGEEGGTGHLTLTGPQKVTGTIITLEKDFNIHFIVAPYGQGLDAVDQTNNLIIFSIKMPENTLPSSTTTYTIVDDPLAGDLSSSEVYISYSEVSGSTIIDYQSQNGSGNFVLVKSGSVYSFSIINLTLMEGPVYTDGPVDYYTVNGSFEFK